jgi:hypothetical protein
MGMPAVGDGLAQQAAALQLYATEVSASEVQLSCVHGSCPPPGDMGFHNPLNHDARCQSPRCSVCQRVFDSWRNCTTHMKAKTCERKSAAPELKETKKQKKKKKKK